MSRFRERTGKYDSVVYCGLNKRQRAQVQRLAEANEKSLSWWLRTLVEEEIDRCAGELPEELGPVEMLIRG